MNEIKEFKEITSICNWTYFKTYYTLLPRRIIKLSKKIISLLKGKLSRKK